MKVSTLAAVRWACKTARLVHLRVDLDTYLLNMLDPSREAATLGLRLAEVHRLNTRRLQWEDGAREQLCDTYMSACH